MTQWPEVELFDRSYSLLGRVNAFRIKDITIHRHVENDLMVFRAGRLVHAWCENRAIPGERREDFVYVLAALRRLMVLDDLAGV